MVKDTWTIAEPAVGVSLTAEADGVWLRAGGRGVAEVLAAGAAARQRLARLLPTLLPQLLEMGLAVEEGGDFRIAHEDFADLESQGVDAFERILPWAPFTLELQSGGNLGWGDFRYKYRFFYGPQVVHLARVGAFVRRGESTYRLDRQTFALVRAVDDFNALPPEAKQGPEAYVRFAEVKGLAAEVGTQLDRFLKSHRVVVPSQIGLDLIVDGERISFAPKVDGVAHDAMWRAFRQHPDVDDVYVVDGPGGGLIHVVLGEAQREALRRMRRVRHLAGRERAEVLRDPHSVFDGVSEVIDLGDFGPRVKGVGDFPFAAQPYLQRSTTGIFDDADGRNGGGKKFDAGVRCRYADGSEEDVRFNSREQVLKFRHEARNAWESGRGVVELAGKSIQVDKTLVMALDELAGRIAGKGAGKNEESPSGRRYLLIYTNEDEVEYAERYEGEGGESGLELPRSLRPGAELKAHQRHGVAWLQRNYRLGRHGCLLADDMGLGKTLQLLTFLSWLIERGDISPGSDRPGSPPWNPILIVAPVILVESETWVSDMRTFFEGEGAVFTPWLNLRGKELQGLKRAKGQETKIGGPVLDLERLREYRVVITNYETVVNYQHSFARMKDQWSVVVTDEAQEYKTPNTKVSHALKSLSPRFRVACTGTPVETRLLDVWNLFDFLQPGRLLGSAAEFRSRFETPVESPATREEVPAVLRQLKERLKFSSPDAFVLRREKRSLPGLPDKTEHRLDCELSEGQRQWHLDILARARKGGEGTHPFALIQQLMRIYQHPSLVPQFVPAEPQELIDACPKLEAVLRCLHGVRGKGEKALVFTRSLDMQQLLASTIKYEFGLEVDIINGVTNRRGGTKSSERTRGGIVRRFRESRGFNVLILSPDVAGMGLTLTEANHVIHYGRWWNPAKESQATDRVYRIGQSRDVHVYLPIARDPRRAFESFDEKLDALIRRRRSLAEDFLAPVPAEGELERELFDSMLSPADGISDVGVRSLTCDDVRRLGWERFEALAAALEEASGARVILTPRGGDGGVDVIARKGRELRLIQCKHTTCEAAVDADVVAEVLIAFEGYRAKHLRPWADRAILKPVLLTNGNFTPRARGEAAARDVELISGDSLSERLAGGCTPAQVEAAEAGRLASMSDLPAAITRLMA